MFESRVFIYSRYFAFILLGAITAYAVYSISSSEWSEVSAYWVSHSGIIPLLILVSIVDVVLECLAWMWVYHRFHVRVFDRIGVLAEDSDHRAKVTTPVLG